MQRNAGFGHILSNRRFLILWSNQILLQLSMNMLNFSLLIWVFRLTHSNTAVSLYIISATLPALVFGVLAGVMADIFDRRKMIMATDIGMALSVLGFLLVKEQLGLILFVSLVFNSFVQFFVPNEAAAIPTLVSKEALIIANSLFFFTMYGMILLGYTLAGPLINYGGQDSVFYIVAVACASAFLIIRLLPPLRAVKEEIEFDVELSSDVVVLVKKAIEVTFVRMIDGFAFVFGNVRVWMAITLLAIFQSVVAIIATLTPGFFEAVVKVSANDTYVIMAPLGLGLLVGAVGVGQWGNKVPRRILIGLGVFFSGVFILAMGLAPIIISAIASDTFMVNVPRSFLEMVPVVAVLAATAFGLGFAAVHIAIPTQTTLQEQTPSAVRGRAFSMLAILNSVGSAVPALIAGAAADVFGIVPVMISLGVLIILPTLAALGLYRLDRSRLPHQIADLLYGA